MKNKDGYLLKWCIIHKQRCFIDDKLKEINLKSNYEQQQFLIDDRYHKEIYCYFLDINNHIVNQKLHFMKYPNDPHYYISKDDIFIKNVKYGYEININ